MRYLKFLQAGGWPFVLDDLNQVQSGWINQSSLGGALFGTQDYEVITLIGAEINTLTGNVSEGVIQVQGVNYPVVSHTYTLPAVGETAYWYPLETSEGGAGDKVFQDSSSHSTYFNIEWRVTSAATVPPEGIPITSTTSAADKLREVLSNQSWHLFDSPNSDGFYGAGATPNEAKRRYFITLDGFVHLKGVYFIDESTPTVLTVGNLPLGYRPPHVMDFTVLSGISSPVSYNVRIETNGDLKILNAEGYNVFKLQTIPAFSIKS